VPVASGVCDVCGKCVWLVALCAGFVLCLSVYVCVCVRHACALVCVVCVCGSLFILVYNTCDKTWS